MARQLSDRQRRNIIWTTIWQSRGSEANVDDYNYWLSHWDELEARGDEINHPFYPEHRLLGWQATGADQALYGPYAVPPSAPHPVPAVSPWADAPPPVDPPVVPPADEPGPQLLFAKIREMQQALARIEDGQTDIEHRLDTEVASKQDLLDARKDFASGLKTALGKIGTGSILGGLFGSKK